MSLQAQAIPPIPEETVRVAHAILPKGNTYIHMRDEFGTFFQDEDFLDLFSEKGQPAESAWRLALVMVMQYAEGVTDRQAADAVRTRIDWKYALSLEITDPGFDFVRHVTGQSIADAIGTGNSEEVSKVNQPT
jgi:transposase